MSSRKINFVLGEYYHIYNRGVEKRSIFSSKLDVDRFFQCMTDFNVKEPIGSIYEKSFLKYPKENQSKPLVSFIAYCLNYNHYHFIVTPLLEKGVESFMHRLGTGYTMYFNEKYRRSGSLFQGRFKASHIDSNEYLLHVSAYVNLNDKTHPLGGSTSKLVRSSWNEYISPFSDKGICKKNIVLKQFNDAEEYRNFALSSLKDIIERKEMEKDLRAMLLD